MIDTATLNTIAELDAGTTVGDFSPGARKDGDVMRAKPCRSLPHERADKPPCRWPCWTAISATFRCARARMPRWPGTMAGTRASCWRPCARLRPGCCRALARCSPSIPWRPARWRRGRRRPTGSRRRAGQRAARVNHNYQRSHAYNLWFVATAADRAALDALLVGIAADSGLPVLDVPLGGIPHRPGLCPAWRSRRPHRRCRPARPADAQRGATPSCWRRWAQAWQR